MATQTPNYNLTKPDPNTDYYNIEVHNDNADKIDTALKDLDDKIEDLNAEDVGAETPTGAQAKADAVMQTHEDDPNPHDQYALDTELAALQNEVGEHKAEDATEAAKGHVEFATVEETLTGTDTTRAVHPAGAKALLSTASARNKNILQNWDFRKPVNQRGLTSYSNVMYTIDRWLWTVAASTRSTAVNSGYVTITNNAGTTGIFGQKLEALEPGTYTLSVQFSDNTVESKTLTWDGSTLTELATSFGALSLRLVDGFPTFAMGIGASKTINVKAVKLEKGNASTIANDPNADFGEQLTLCQRYCLELNPYGAPYVTVGFGRAGSTTSCFVVIPLPVTMRITPTITRSGQWRIDSGEHYIVTSITAGSMGANALKLNVSTETSMSGVFCELTANDDPNARMLLSADL